MSALFFLGLALGRFRLSGAAKLGLLLFATQAALFDGVILHPASEPAHAQATIAARMEEPPQKSPAAAQCREETITVDEGYGLRGQETRLICGR
ncbi:MAG: hypothetical protein WAK01_15760 [Methylocystis sp.]